MRNVYFLRLMGVILLFCCCSYSSLNAQERNIPEHLIKYVPSQVYWQVNEGIEVPTFERADEIQNGELDKIKGLAAIVSGHHVRKIETAFRFWRKDDALSRTYIVHFSDDKGAENLIRSLEELTTTTYSEKIPAMETFMPPNDILYPQQWYLPHINAEDAWAVNDCSGSGIVIAIVDDAILTTHEDLASKITGGFDVADGDSDPNPTPSLLPIGNPYFSHGTHVAGIAGAATNNMMIGMASMGHDCMIMPIKTKRDDNTTLGGLDNPYDGVLQAITDGADVINMSWGGYGYSATHANIMSQAYNAGIVCVAAAGNDGVPFAAYPAAYPHVIGVGATNQSNQKASFSNYGWGVDLMAPGVGILSSIATGIDHYDAWNGTSMASPIVAGLAALYLCEHGGNPNTNPNTIAGCLGESALDIDGNNPGLEGELGSGLIQADATLNCEPSDMNDCTPDECELVPNGDFETPVLSNFTEYDKYDPFADGQVCGWQDAWGSPHLYSRFEAEENHLRVWDTEWSPGEGAITIDPLDLTPGTLYCMEYDYAGANDLINVDFRLVAAGTSTGGTGTIIDQLVDVAPDVTGIHLWNDDFNPVGQHHREVSFIAPAADFHLLIYPTYTGDQSGDTPAILIDNISIHPCLEITASADQDTICYGYCTYLNADVVGGDGVIWEPAYGLDDPTSLNPLACPDETTTYTVTVYDSETGCTTSDEVTVVVIPCDPIDCDDIITVEGVCTEDGVLLTAHINGVPIDPSSTAPTYTITWEGANGVDYVNDNPVLYPLGTAYTLKVGVIYQTNPLICCHYELDLVADGVLDIEIEASPEEICQFTCTQLSVNAPAGSTIVWMPADGLDDPNSPTPIACPLETTTYTVAVYDPLTGCSGTDEITIVVDEDCDCEDAKIEVVEECNGYETVVKVLINGVAIDPSDLDWIDINWDILNGTTNDIVDENCVTLPVGTKYEVYITYGIDLNVPTECCHHWIEGEVTMDCVDCDFSVVEFCKGKTVCVTLVNSAGVPIVPGNNGDYNFVIWWDYNMSIIPNVNPLCIPAGSTYSATLFIYKGEKLVCTNSVNKYIADCCNDTKECCGKFNSSGVQQTYTTGEDIVVSWDPNGATEYIVEVEHNYQNCEPDYCTFSITDGSTYISLADEGCYYTCQEYTITVTAVCPDGTTSTVTLPSIFTNPPNGQLCLACSDPGGDGETDLVGEGDGGGKGEEGKGKTSLDVANSQDIALYPNPAKDLLSINFGAEYQTATIEVLDMSGKRLQVIQTQDSHSAMLDVSALPEAVYIARITLDNQTAIHTKFAIVK